MYWRGSREDFDVDATRKVEESLTKKQRRARYRCRSNYVRLIDLDPWPLYGSKHLGFDHTKNLNFATPLPAVPTAVEPVAPTPLLAAEQSVASTAGDQVPQEELRVASTAGDQAPQEQAATTELAQKEEDGASAVVTEVVDQVVPSTQHTTPANENPPEKNEVDEANQLTQNIKEDSTDDEETKKEEKKDMTEAEYLLHRNINRKLCTWRGDITRLEIDAVVNAANRSLLGGGGIDGAIHSAAGHQLYLECKTLKGCDTGYTKVTRGYQLPAKYVLHTVGPIGEHPTELQSCYETILQLCLEKNIRSVAFCGVSTGIFGYPLENASRIACTVVRKWMEVPENLNKIDRIIFCTFLEKEKYCYDHLLQEYFPLVPDEEFITSFQKEREDYVSSEEEEEEKPEEDDTDEDDTDEDDTDDVGGKVTKTDPQQTTTEGTKQTTPTNNSTDAATEHQQLEGMKQQPLSTNFLASEDTKEITTEVLKQETATNEVATDAAVQDISSAQKDGSKEGDHEEPPTTQHSSKHPSNNDQSEQNEPTATETTGTGTAIATETTGTATVTVTAGTSTVTTTSTATDEKKEEQVQSPPPPNDSSQ